MTSQTKPRSTSDVLAGGVSGLVCGLIIQPLEVLKVNMIILPQNYHNYRQRSFIQNFTGVGNLIYKEEGIKGFWRGTTPAVLRSASSSAIYFYTLRKLDSIDKKRYNLETSFDFINSAVARSLTAIVNNPLTIIRTRSELLGSKDYNNFIGSCRLIYKEEGLKSFYKGGLLLLLEEFPFGGIFNATYEFLNRQLGYHENHSKLGYLFSGTVAGIVASSFTHPFELCRTKMQSQRVDFSRKVKNSVILSIFVDTYERYGFVGLFKGLLPRMMKKTIVNASTFTMYEIIRKREVK